MNEMNFLNSNNRNIKEKITDYKIWLQQKGVKDTLEHYYDWADSVDCSKLVRELI